MTQAQRQLNILAVSTWCPYPADNGSRLRAYHLLRQLARQGHRLTLIAMTQDDSDPAAAQPVLEALCAGGVRLFPARWFRRGTLKSVVGFFSPRPRSLLDTYQPEAAAAIAQECRSADYDVIFALELGVAHYVPADACVRGLLDQVEVSSLLKPAREAASWRKRLRLEMMGWKFRAHVAALAPRFAEWTAVSEAERGEILAVLGRRALPVTVLPNGVDLEGNAYQPETPYDPDRLIYNGALSFSQNLEAVRFFAAEVLPLIRRERPEAHLWVTGRNGVLTPDDPLRHDRAVTLTGYLDDIGPAVRGAAACVVPLLQGGGTRLKILEAMALGTPVVATPRGAEGLDAADGRQILLAQTPQDLAAATLRVMAEPALRARLSLAGRQFVEARYGWDAIGATLVARLQALAGPVPEGQQEKICL